MGNPKKDTAKEKTEQFLELCTTLFADKWLNLLINHAQNLKTKEQGDGQKPNSKVKKHRKHKKRVTVKRKHKKHRKCKNGKKGVKCRKRRQKCKKGKKGIKCRRRHHKCKKGKKGIKCRKHRKDHKRSHKKKHKKHRKHKKTPKKSVADKVVAKVEVKKISNVKPEADQIDSEEEDQPMHKRIKINIGKIVRKAKSQPPPPVVSKKNLGLGIGKLVHSSTKTITPSAAEMKITKVLAENQKLKKSLMEFRNKNSTKTSLGRDSNPSVPLYAKVITHRRKHRHRHKTHHHKLNARTTRMHAKKILAKSEAAAIAALTDPHSDASEVSNKIVDLNTKLEKNVADLSADELIEMASRLLIS